MMLSQRSGAGEASGVERPAAHIPIPSDLGDHDPHPDQFAPYPPQMIGGDDHPRRARAQPRAGASFRPRAARGRLITGMRRRSQPLRKHPAGLMPVARAHRLILAVL